LGIHHGGYGEKLPGEGSLTVMERVGERNDRQCAFVANALCVANGMMFDRFFSSPDLIVIAAVIA
jgi:hypothetical protein